MIEQTATTAALVVAMMCGVCLVVALPTLAGAVLRGQPVRAFRSGVVVLIAVMVALAAFVVLGSEPTLAPTL